MVTKSQDGTVEVNEIAAERILVPIIGTSPLIIHRFSEKAKRKMLDSMQGRKPLKEIRDPQADYEDALYKFKDGGNGFPVIAFKAATVSGARFYHGVTMTSLRQFMFFWGEPGINGQGLARIVGEPRMREDFVRVNRGGADLRFRPEFPEWSTTLEVVYVTSALTQSSVLSLINAGGMGAGVGEWRPERDGDFGTYRVDTTRDIEVVAPTPKSKRGAKS